MIPSGGAEKVRAWFDSFTSGFLCDDEGINREILERVRHSERVAENITTIFQNLTRGARSIPLSLLVTAALLHDVGRFPMIFRNDVSRNREMKDHASEGVKLLKKLNVLKDFGERERELIFQSIYFHNKKGAHLQCGDEEVIAISELLRKADKMDISGSRDPG